MGELYLPTTADYAYAAASDLPKHVKQLEARLEKLERQPAYFHLLLSQRGEGK